MYVYTVHQILPRPSTALDGTLLGDRICEQTRCWMLGTDGEAAQTEPRSLRAVTVVEGLDLKKYIKNDKMWCCDRNNPGVRKGNVRGRAFFGQTGAEVKIKLRLAV